MKKNLFFLFVLLFAVHADLKASHMMGGEITAAYDSVTGNTYVNLTVYRDVYGIQLPGTVSLSINKYNNVTSQYEWLQQATLPYNAALSTALLPNFPYGVEVGVYTSTLTLPPGQHRLKFSFCCRNLAIVNALYAGNDQITLATDLYIPVTGMNSTPVFLHKPIAYFPLGQLAHYNPLPYDAEGDSLAWALKTPIDLWNDVNLPPQNVSGHTIPPADPTGPFTMNSFTGEITWKPNVVGNFIQAFDVNEYRNGVQIGNVIRDMQYVIVPASSINTNFVPVTPYSHNNQENYNYVFYQSGQPFTFDIKGYNPDPNVILTMTVDGGIFYGANPPVFTVAANGNGNITGQLQWTPDVNMDKDHVIAFRLTDGNYTTDHTLVLRKDPGPSRVVAGDNIIRNISVYPNPTAEQVNIALSLNKEIDGLVELYNSIGQKVRVLYEGMIPKGQTLLTEKTDLPHGLYQLVIKDRGEVVKTLPVIIR